MPPLPQIGIVTVKCGLVYLNDRVEPDNSRFWDVPTGTALVITDLVAQNRGPEIYR
jgi:phosphoribosylaminoimidazole-succinocarboxamide synthase